MNTKISDAMVVTVDAAEHIKALEAATHWSSTSRPFKAALLAGMAALAARQPGAQEPVAVVGSDFTICWVGSGPITPLVERHGIKRGSLLYATAPAQGMDLGQFRDLIGFAVLHAIYLPESDPRRDFIRQANELLALIDSRPTLATVTPPRDLRTQLGEA